MRELDGKLQGNNKEIQGKLKVKQRRPCEMYRKSMRKLYATIRKTTVNA